MVYFVGYFWSLLQTDIVLILRKQINALERTEGKNHEWTFQRHLQHWAHKTQYDDKQNRSKAEHNTETWKDQQDEPTKYRGWRKVLVKSKQFLPLTKLPPYYLYSQVLLGASIHKQTQIGNKISAILQTNGGKDHHYYADITTRN